MRCLLRHNAKRGSARGCETSAFRSRTSSRYRLSQFSDEQRPQTRQHDSSCSERSRARHGRRPSVPLLPMAKANCRKSMTAPKDAPIAAHPAYPKPCRLSDVRSALRNIDCPHGCYASRKSSPLQPRDPRLIATGTQMLKKRARCRSRKHSPSG